MSQNAEIASIKNKIKALLSKTINNGCTEEEAISAANMAGKLMEQYNINISELDIKNETCITENVFIGKNNSNMRFVSVAISRFCNCETWTSREYAKNLDGTTDFNARCDLFYNFFGFPNDVKMAIYLYHLINNAMKYEVAQFKKTDVYTGKSSSNSFLMGMANRISARLNEMHNASVDNINKMRGNTSSGTSIMIVKDKIVQEQLSQLKFKFKYSRNTCHIKNHYAYQFGLEAGSKINLNRPINSNNNQEIAG